MYTFNFAGITHVFETKQEMISAMIDKYAFMYAVYQDDAFGSDEEREHLDELTNMKAIILKAIETPF